MNESDTPNWNFDADPIKAWEYDQGRYDGISPTRYAIERHRSGERVPVWMGDTRLPGGDE